MSFLIIVHRLDELLNQDPAELLSTQTRSCSFVLMLAKRKLEFCSLFFQKSIAVKPNNKIAFRRLQLAGH